MCSGSIIVISKYKRTVDVGVFISAAKRLVKVQIVNALLSYNFKCTMYVYVLVARDVL